MRLQIVPLPQGGTKRSPFILVIDQVSDAFDYYGPVGLAEAINAPVLVLNETVEVIGPHLETEVEGEHFDLDAEILLALIAKLPDPAVIVKAIMDPERAGEFFGKPQARDSSAECPGQDRCVGEGNCPDPKHW